MQDSGDHIATHLDFSISIKAFTFIFDVSPDGGVPCIVPGTHRVQFGPTRVTEDFKAARARTFPCTAGTTVFYDNRVWVSLGGLCASLLGSSPHKELLHSTRRCRTPRGATAAA